MEVERIHFKEIASTHEFAKEREAAFDRKKLTCITADVQCAGRGRYANRQWVSKKGNLHLTLFLAIDPNPNLAQLLAFSAAQVIGHGVLIKWPNDLLFEGKKFSGTIADVTSHGVVLSIGVNVNADVETDQPTTSLKSITNREWDLNELSQAITTQFLHNLVGDFPCAQFNELLTFRGKTVVCAVGAKRIKGVLLGIDKEGFLRLQTKQGQVQTLSSGEISIAEGGSYPE